LKTSSGEWVYAASGANETICLGRWLYSRLVAHAGVPNAVMTGNLTQAALDLLSRAARYTFPTGSATASCCATIVSNQFAKA